MEKINKKNGLFIIFYLILIILAFIFYIPKKPPPLPKIPPQPVWISKGEQFRRAQKWQKAKDFYIKAVKEHPKQIELWLTLSDLLQDKFQQPKEAALTYEKAVALQPQSAEAWYMLSIKWKNAKNISRSIAALKHAMTLQPNRMDFHLELLNLYYWAGQYEPYRQTYEWILKKEPNNLLALLAQARYATHFSRWEQAIQAYESVFKQEKISNIEEYKEYFLALKYAGKQQRMLDYLKKPPRGLTVNDIQSIIDWMKTKIAQQKKISPEKKYPWIVTEAKQYDLKDKFNFNHLPKEGLKAELDGKFAEAEKIYQQYFSKHSKHWEALFRAFLIYQNINKKLNYNQLQKLYVFFSEQRSTIKITSRLLFK